MTDRHERFLVAANAVGVSQLVLLRKAQEIFDENEFPGISQVVEVGKLGWEGRLMHKMLERTAVLFREAHPAGSPVPYDLSQPLIRGFNCLKCGANNNAIEPRGACCYGQPECKKCGHQVHESVCKIAKGE